MRPILCLVLSALVVVAGEEAAPPRGTLTSGTVTLLSRQKYNDYEKATFSFEHGIRDDPGLRRTHNDWELEYGNGGDTLNVLMVTDDRSVIVDLGEKALADITALPAFPAYKEGVTTRVAAIEGHAYAVRTRDTESDHVSAFRVVKLLAGDQCTIEWVHWKPREAAGPELDLAPDIRARLERVLDQAPPPEGAVFLRDPLDIVLRVCTGPQRGTPSRVALDGLAYRVRDAMGDESDVPGPREDAEDPTWFWRGGLIPKGRVLVLESIDVFALASGEDHGEAIVELPSGAVFATREEGPFQIWFEGLELVRPGEERRLVVQAAHSSAVEARIRGRLVAADEAARLERRPMTPAAAPAGIARAGGKVDGARSYLLEQPWLVLQVRAGAGGGNPNRVTMLGRGSIYLKKLSKGPIDLETPVGMDEDAVGYTTAGRIPRDKVFVVKKATWRARAKGDSNGHGEARLQIGTEEIFKFRDTADLQEGTWTGEIEIRPGEEATVYLEVANSSLAEVILEGAWK
ncbi:MAG: hypothetical protein ACHQ1G_05135 [Planctomycetota bacterium]